MVSLTYFIAAGLALDTLKGFLLTGLCSKNNLVMNKQELISAVAERAGLNRDDVSHDLNVMLEVITSALERGDDVRLVGFGAFSVTRRKASTGRNPRTGEPLEIPSSANPKFKAGKVLKSAVQ